MKIIGNYWLLLLCVCTPLVARVQLNVLDKKGKAIQEVAVGEPFTVRVKISGAAGGNEPIVQGIEQVQLLGNKSIMRSHTNGDVSTQYTYTGVIHTPGSYILGPAEIVYAGASDRSNVVRIEVATEVKRTEPIVKKNDVVLQVNQPKKTVYVGEKVPLSVRFLYADDDVQPSRIHKPSFAHFDVVQEEGARKGEQILHGTSYRYVELSFLLYPQEAGHVALEPFRAEYSVPIDESNFSSMFLWAFGGGRETKRVASSRVAFLVKALPVSEHDVRAVGDYSLFTASVDHGVARRGDAMVLTLQLHGDGNADRVPEPALVLPEGLTAHYSKSYWADGGNHRVRAYEYILQGTLDGKITLPEQKWVFFNVHKERYQTLTTQPLTLAILPRAGADEVSSVQQQEIEEQQSEQKKEELAPAHRDGPLAARRTRSLPWWVMVLVVVGPLFGMLGIWIFGVLRKYTTRMTSAHLAHQRLAAVRVGTSTESLYRIMIDFFTSHIKAHPITADQIIMFLQEHGMSSQDLAEWQQFFATVQEHYFAGIQEVAPELIEQAATWINRLEELV